jgi:hypothetical protein
MNFPPLLRVLLRQGAVVYAQDRHLSSPLPHYLVVLSHTPFSAQELRLAVVTSKVDKVRRYAQARNCPPGTLVELDHQSYPPLRLPSIIDCNLAIRRPFDQFVADYRSKALAFRDHLPAPLLARILEGVRASPLLLPEDKSAILPP